MTDQTKPNIDEELYEHICRRIKRILMNEQEPLRVKNLISSEDSFHTELGTLRILWERKKDD
jgi:hypothetical protein